MFTETGVSSSFSTTYGNYTILITDLQSGCTLKVPQFLPIANSHQLELSAFDITKCVPLKGGKIDAKLTTTDPSIYPFTQQDYEIVVFATDEDPDPTGTGTPTGVNVPTSGGAQQIKSYPIDANIDASLFNTGFYTVVAISHAGPTIDCRVSSTVEINRVTTNPIVNNTVIDNTKCFPKNSGEIDLTLGGSFTGDTDPLTYDFTWIDGS